MADTKTIYIVRKFVDGNAEIYGHCETNTTAQRISATIPGSDIIQWEAVLHNGFWCAPYREILATVEDQRKDAETTAYNLVLQKALSAGLTLQEIRILEEHDNGPK